jgi:hypothetical protein
MQPVAKLRVDSLHSLQVRVVPEKRIESPANENLPQSSARPSSIPVDIRNHIRAREAVRALLDRHKKVFVTRRSFDTFGRPVSRIFLDGKYYDVNQRQLALIQEGASPEDLWGVEAVEDSDEG